MVNGWDWFRLCLSFNLHYRHVLLLYSRTSDHLVLGRPVCLSILPSAYTKTSNTSSQDT